MKLWRRRFVDFRKVMHFYLQVFNWKNNGKNAKDIYELPGSFKDVWSTSRRWAIFPVVILAYLMFCYVEIKKLNMPWLIVSCLENGHLMTVCCLNWIQDKFLVTKFMIHWNCLLTSCYLGWWGSAQNYWMILGHVVTGIMMKQVLISGRHLE